MSPDHQCAMATRTTMTAMALVLILAISGAIADRRMVR